MNTTATPSDRQVFIPIFLASLDTITLLTSSQRNGVVVNGSGNTTVYTFGERMKDLSKTDCNLCFAFQRLVRGGKFF